MFLFYSPDLIPDPSTKTFQHTLNREESHHAIHVIRLLRNAPIQISNGKGILFTGKIIDPDPKACVIQIEGFSTLPSRPYQLKVAIAPTKNIDRFEWFVEKATEIGIDEITPIICQNSERRILNLERIQKVLVSAMKQSGQAFLPRLNSSISLEEFSKSELVGLGFIAHCKPLPKFPLKQVLETPNSKIFNLLIGPEGDFTLAEISTMDQKGYKGLDLGPNRLRTETAALLIVARFTELSF